MAASLGTVKYWLDRPIGMILLALLTAIVGVAVAKFDLPVAAMILFGVVGIVYVLAVINNPYFGMYSLLAYTFFMFLPGRIVNVEIPLGFVVEIITILLLMSTLIRKKMINQQLDGFFRKPISMMLVVYCALLLVEFFNPNMLSYSGLFFYYRKVFTFLLFYYIAYLLLDDLDKIKRFIKIWLILSFLVGLYTCKQQWFGFFGFENSWLNSDPHKVKLYYQGGMFRKMSFLSDPSANGILLAFTAVMALIFAQFTRSVVRRRWLYFASIVMLLGVSYSGTRTAYIVIAIGVSIYILMNFTRKRTLIFTGVSLLALAFILFGPIQSQSINRIRSLLQGTKDASLQVRDENRQLIRPYMLSHPIGGGLATNGVEGEKFNPGHELAGFPTDSGYLKFALEAGWVGLVVLCLLYFVIIQQCIHYYYKLKDPSIKAIYCALAAGLFGQMVAHYGQIAIGQMPGIVFFFMSFAIIGRLPQFDDPQKESELS